MNIEQLERYLQVAGRYEVYSNGTGDYQVLPVPDSAILITRESAQQVSALSEELIYNNQQG